MDKIIIRGGKPLSGRIPISGVKNAALTLMPAAILTDEPLTLRNLPRLADIDTFSHLLNQHGVSFTLEFSNTTPLPAKVYANEGACQFLFLQGNEPCEVSYADRAGKYQGQRGVPLPRL